MKKLLFALVLTGALTGCATPQSRSEERGQDFAFAALTLLAVLAAR